MRTEQVVAGNVMAYRSGREVVVEARGHCAVVPGWSMKPKLKRRINVTRSCGNVYADLGLPDADELYSKSVESFRTGRCQFCGARMRLRKRYE